MSIILSRSHNAALSCPHGSLRSRNITPLLKVVYSSTSTARPAASPRSRRPACFLEGYVIFSKDPKYPDISVRPEVSHTRNNVPGDLASLRPPPLDYVEGPEETKDGRITLYQRFLYWRRLGKAYYKFYQEGMRKVSENQRERERILSRYNATQNPVSITRIALYEPYRGPAGKRQELGAVPRLTRREYNICIRTMEDVRKLGRFSLILFFFRQLTPLIHRFLRPVIPGPCRRQQDYMRDVKRYINSWESFIARFHDQDEIFAGSQFGEAMNQATKRRHMLYTAVLRTSIFSGLAIYVPPSFTDLALRLYQKGLMIRNIEILADTALIMREGGFSKLSTQDVVDYCIRSGSVTFYHWARKAVKNGVDPANAAMRKEMVDILEQHAKKMLDCDWPRLPPHSLWKQELFVRIYHRTAPDSWYFDKNTARR